MIHSMTGFARASSRKKKGGWSVEIRSLNHRYFEFSLKASPSLYPLEDRIREFCQREIRRGKVTVNISEEEASGLAEVTLDEKVLRFYLSALRKVQRRFQLKGSLSVSDVLSLPRIFSVEKKAVSPERLWSLLKPVLGQALERLQQARLREGRALAKDLLVRIRKIQGGLERIEGRVQGLPQAYYEKLRGRIQSLFDTRAEDPRIWQEAALLAERADVTEELIRLKSHIRLFLEKIKGEHEVGKELDFIVQEMNREANTLSAKGQDVGLSREVVSIKAELEKIREQVQNIE